MMGDSKDNRCRTIRHISSQYPPQPLIPRKRFCRKYVQLPEVESGGHCINLELYQDNLACEADTPPKLYHIDLKG